MHANARPNVLIDAVLPEALTQTQTNRLVVGAVPRSLAES